MRRQISTFPCPITEATEGRDHRWQKVYDFTTSISWEKRPQFHLACEGGWPVPCGDCVNLCPARNGLCSNQSGGRHTGLWLKGHTAVCSCVFVSFFFQLKTQNTEIGKKEERGFVLSETPSWAWRLSIFSLTDATKLWRLRKVCCGLLNEQPKTQWNNGETENRVLRLQIRMLKAWCLFG